MHFCSAPLSSYLASPNPGVGLHAPGPKAVYPQQRSNSPSDKNSKIGGSEWWGGVCLLFMCNGYGLKRSVCVCVCAWMCVLCMCVWAGSVCRWVSETKLLSEDSHVGHWNGKRQRWMRPLRTGWGSSLAGGTNRTSSNFQNKSKGDVNWNIARLSRGAAHWVPAAFYLDIWWWCYNRDRPSLNKHAQGDESGRAKCCQRFCGLCPSAHAHTHSHAQHRHSTRWDATVLFQMQNVILRKVLCWQILSLSATIWCVHESKAVWETSAPPATGGRNSSIYLISWI